MHTQTSEAAGLVPVLTDQLGHSTQQVQSGTGSCGFEETDQRWLENIGNGLLKG